MLVVSVRMHRLIAILLMAVILALGFVMPHFGPAFSRTSDNAFLVDVLGNADYVRHQQAQLSTDKSYAVLVRPRNTRRIHWYFWGLALLLASLNLWIATREPLGARLNAITRLPPN